MQRNPPRLPASGVQPQRNPGVVQQGAVQLGSIANLPLTMGTQPQGAGLATGQPTGQPTGPPNQPPTQPIQPVFRQQPNVAPQSNNPTFTNMSDLHNYLLTQGRRLYFSRRGGHQGPSRFSRP